MRKLMLFTLGFAGACAAACYLFDGIWLLAGLFLSLLFLLPLIFCKKRAAHVVMFLLIGLSAGFLWNWGQGVLFLNTAKAYDGSTVQASILVTDYSDDSDYGHNADGQIELDGKTYRVRLYTSLQEQLEPGDLVEGAFRLRYTPGGEYEATYHKGEGTFLIAYADDSLQVYSGDPGPLRFIFSRLRNTIRQALLKSLPEDVSGFALALLLGDDSLLTFQQDEAFQTSGIRHVIAVSGLHISILFSVVSLISAKRPVLTLFVATPVLLAFAALAGFTPSVIRACIMQILIILSNVLYKDYDLPTSISFSALVMLVLNPMTITSVSFQLSIGCVIGIGAFSQPIRSFLYSDKLLGSAKGRGILPRLKRWIAGSISVTLSAMTFTVPLCAIYFRSVSLIGILTNLLTLWVISFIFYGCMVCCVLAFIWLPAAKVVGWVVAWPIRYVLGVAGLLSRVPFGAVYTDNAYIILWIIVSYFLIAGFILNGKRHPCVVTACICSLLVLSVGAGYVESAMDNYTMTVMDVGHGQCILLQADGRNYLVDCGGDTSHKAAMTAIRRLRSRGVFRLDGIVITHFDEDHCGGIPYLLSCISADQIFAPDTELDDRTRKQLILKHSDKLQLLQEPLTLEWEDNCITIYPAQGVEKGNESSMCILFQAGNCDILITGDRSAFGEQALISQTDIPKLEILIAGHHGSESSSDLSFLMQTRPALAVISTSDNRSQSLEKGEVLQRFALIDCIVRRTDLEGTIVIRG